MQKKIVVILYTTHIRKETDYHCYYMSNKSCPMYIDTNYTEMDETSLT